MQAMVELTHAVAEGTGAPDKLAYGLATARAEVDRLAQQLEDESFATDEVSRSWRTHALESLERFAHALALMAGALEASDADVLLHGLDQAIHAEAGLREVFTQAHESYGQVQEAIQAAQRVPCVRCGHRNVPGRSSCDRCRFPLPQTGVERMESDVIGGEPTARESSFLRGLDQVIHGLEQPGGLDQAHAFVQKLEQLQVMARRQLDTLLSRYDHQNEAVAYTVEIRRRVEDVRQMLEAVRLSLEAGDVHPLLELPPWLADQFQVLQDLKAAVVEASGS